MKAWVVPPGPLQPGMKEGSPGPAGVEMPALTPELARRLARSLKDSRPALLRLGNETILRAIEETVADWVSPQNEARAHAESVFRSSTGLSAATAPFATTIEACEGGRFRQWIRAEIGPLGVLEGFTAGPDGGILRASGPGLAVHVLPGNVPLVWLPAFLAFLVMRTPCLVKPALADPLTPALFVDTLLRHLPALAPAIAVLPWIGGDREVEGAVLSEAEAVVAYGEDESVRSLAAQLPPSALLAAHGSRFAAGAIAREALQPGRIDTIAAAIARDVLLHDGKGCLSLSVLFIERDGLCTPREAAEAFARALSDWARQLPPGKLDPDIAAATQGWRGRQKARALAGKPSALFGSEGNLAWSLFYDEELAPPAQAFCRSLWMTPVDSLEEIPSRLNNLKGRLHALAFAGPDKRRLETAEMLVPFGITRVCAFGELQNPPLSWPHAGTSPFRQFLRWTRVER